MTPDLSRFTRAPERQATDREELHEFLDSQFVGVLASVAEGQPWVVPMLYARDGDLVLLHGSTGAGLLRHVAAGAPVAFCVTSVDGLVVAHSTFDSSVNYRSAVIRGVLEQARGSSERDLLDTFSDQLMPGRTGEVRPSSAKEVAATLALRLPITADNWLMKTRTGPPDPPENPAEQSVWCGVVPLALTAGSPQSAGWSVGPVPESVHAFIAGHPQPS